MKMTPMTLLAGASCSLIVCGSVHAAYTGLTLVYSDVYFANHPDQAIRDAWNAGPVHEYNIYRLYANFNSNTPADRVNAVAGAPGSPLFINLYGGVQFHNYTEELHGETVHFHLPLTANAPPERSWDTYVTIGNAINGGSTGVTPGFGLQTGNLGYQNDQIGPTTNAAWFVPPNQPQSQAVASAPGQAHAPPGKYRVLLAQITLPEAAIDLTGTMLVNVNGTDMLHQSLPHEALVYVDHTVGDATGDGLVTVEDLLAVVSAWGACKECSWCPADLYDLDNFIFPDCQVDVEDLLFVLGNWSSP